METTNTRDSSTFSTAVRPSGPESSLSLDGKVLHKRHYPAITKDKMMILIDIDLFSFKLLEVNMDECHR